MIRLSKLKKLRQAIFPGGLIPGELPFAIAKKAVL
jgi:hypothetical protein